MRLLEIYRKILTEASSELDIDLLGELEAWKMDYDGSESARTSIINNLLKFKVPDHLRFVSGPIYRIVVSYGEPFDITKYKFNKFESWSTSISALKDTPGYQNGWSEQDDAVIITIDSPKKDNVYINFNLLFKDKFFRKYLRSDDHDGDYWDETWTYDPEREIIYKCESSNEITSIKKLKRK